VPFIEKCGGVRMGHVPGVLFRRLYENLCSDFGIIYIVITWKHDL